jgi:hypothetical protein
MSTYMFREDFERRLAPQETLLYRIHRLLNRLRFSHVQFSDPDVTN